MAWIEIAGGVAAGVFGGPGGIVIGGILVTAGTGQIPNEC